MVTSAHSLVNHRLGINVNYILEYGLTLRIVGILNGGGALYVSNLITTSSRGFLCSLMSVYRLVNFYLTGVLS